MKILLFAIFLVLFLGFSLAVEGKTSNICILTIILKDNQNKVIENAEIKTFNESFKIVKKWGDNSYEKLKWSGEFKAYQAGTIDCDHIQKIGIRISAQGFELYEKVITLFSNYPNSFAVKLKSIGTNEISTIKQLSSLSGQIQDFKKRPIPNIKVLLTNRDGKEIKKFTDINGYYHFYNLTSGGYSIKIVGANGLSTVNYKKFQLPLVGMYIDTTLKPYTKGNVVFTQLNCKVSEFTPHPLKCELLTKEQLRNKFKKRKNNK